MVRNRILPDSIIVEQTAEGKKDAKGIMKDLASLDFFFG